MLWLWIIIFIASLVLLVKSADWLVISSEKIGLAFGMAPFVVGVTIVALGTSFPEMASSLAAVAKNASEIVVANVFGSNIANIVLVAGLAAIATGCLKVSRNLIDLDGPLLLMATVLALGVVWDKVVTWPEGILLVVAFFVYLAYTTLHHGGEEEKKSLPPARVERRAVKEARPKISSRDFLFLGLGIVGLCFGAKYAVEATLKISDVLKIATGVIAMLAIAVGTSLPELVVSVQAARKGKYEMALGNVFGSNIFNLLLVIGVPSFFGNLVVDAPTFQIGLPVLLIVTLLFVISSISRHIHKWEGAMYLLIYILFIAKLFNIF